MGIQFSTASGMTSWSLVLVLTSHVPLGAPDAGYQFVDTNAGNAGAAPDLFFASPPPPSPLLLPTLPLLLLTPTVHFHGFDPRFPHLHFINFATSFHNPLQPISARMYRFRSYNVKLYFMLSVHLILLGCRTPMGGA